MIPSLVSQQIAPRYLTLPAIYTLFMNMKQHVGSISMIVLKIVNRVNSDSYYQDIKHEYVEEHSRNPLWTMCELADIFASETKCK